MLLLLFAGDSVQSNIEPAVKSVKDMVAEFEAISMKMSEPDADIDSLSVKMDKLQVRFHASIHAHKAHVRARACPVFSMGVLCAVVCACACVCMYVCVCVCVGGVFCPSA